LPSSPSLRQCLDAQAGAMFEPAPGPGGGPADRALGAPGLGLGFGRAGDPPLSALIGSDMPLPSTWRNAARTASGVMQFEARYNLNLFEKQHGCSKGLHVKLIILKSQSGAKPPMAVNFLALKKF